MLQTTILAVNIQEGNVSIYKGQFTNQEEIIKTCLVLMGVATEVTEYEELLQNYSIKKGDFEIVNILDDGGNSKGIEQVIVDGKEVYRSDNLVEENLNDDPDGVFKMTE